MNPASAPLKSCASFPFLKLPIEIRLLIYHELLVQGPGFSSVFCLCRSPFSTKNRPCGNSPLFPAILQTNKTVYNEAWTILYSKNTFHLLCPKSSSCSRLEDSNREDPSLTPLWTQFQKQYSDHRLLVQANLRRACRNRQITLWDRQIAALRDGQLAAFRYRQMALDASSSDSSSDSSSESPSSDTARASLRTSLQTRRSPAPRKFTSNSSSACSDLLSECRWCWRSDLAISNCPNPAARPYLKHLTVEFGTYQIPLERFLKGWKEKAEPQILGIYENLRSIAIRLQEPYGECPELLLELVRQQEGPRQERAQDYETVLSNLPRQSPLKDKFLNAITDMCNVIVVNHAQGAMKDSKFGVRAISWSGNYTPQNIYLGCHKYISRDLAAIPKKMTGTMDVARD